MRAILALSLGMRKGLKHCLIRAIIVCRLAAVMAITATSVSNRLNTSYDYILYKMTFICYDFSIFFSSLM